MTADGRHIDVEAQALRYKKMDDHDLLITVACKVDMMADQLAEIRKENTSVLMRLEDCEKRLIRHEVYFAILGGGIVLLIPLLTWIIDMMYH